MEGRAFMLDQNQEGGGINSRTSSFLLPPYMPLVSSFHWLKQAGNQLFPTAAILEQQHKLSPYIKLVNLNFIGLVVLSLICKFVLVLWLFSIMSLYLVFHLYVYLNNSLMKVICQN